MAEWEEYIKITTRYDTSTTTVNLDFLVYEYRMFPTAPSGEVIYTHSSLGNIYNFAVLHNFSSQQSVPLTVGMGDAYPSKQGNNYFSKSSSGTTAPVVIERRLLWTPPNLKTNINGQLKEYENGWVNINGELREIDKMWTRIDDVLREV